MFVHSKRKKHAAKKRPRLFQPSSKERENQAAKKADIQTSSKKQIKMRKKEVKKIVP